MTTNARECATCRGSKVVSVGLDIFPCLRCPEPEPRRYRCPECCDTGCVVEPSIAVLMTEGDGLVPCPHCIEREQKVIAIRQILPSALNAAAIEFLRDNAVEILGEPKK